MSFTYTIFDRKRRYGEQTVAACEDFIQTTWNDLFFKISPIVAGTASTASVRGVLSQLIAAKWDHDYPEKAKGLRAGNPMVSGDFLQTIKIQFIALGLIKIEKKRKYEHSSTETEYRSLTKLGEKKMFALRAIKKSGKK